MASHGSGVPSFTSKEFRLNWWVGKVSLGRVSLNIRPKKLWHDIFETALSIGINGNTTIQTLLLSGCDIAFQVDVYE